jgi:outer membrane protein assembly factor BamB
MSALSRGLFAGCLAVAVALCAGAWAQAPAAPAKPRAIRKGLAVEDLGVPVTGRTIGKTVFYKEPKSGATRLLLTFEAADGRGDDPPFQIYDLDLETGKARLVMAMPGRVCPDGPLLHTNGKIYMGTGRPSALGEYDPATGAFRNCGRVQERLYASVHSLGEREDGLIFIGTLGLHLAVYDPSSGKMEDLGKMGPSDEGYIYFLGFDGDDVHCVLRGYGAEGTVVYNTKTRKARHYLKNEKTGAWTCDGKEVPASEAPREVKTSTVIFRGTPMYAMSQSDKSGHEFDLDGAQPSGWNGGEVAVRWRKRGDAEWRESRTKGVDIQPISVKRLAPLPDGTLLGMSAMYSTMFHFDPATRKSTWVGMPPGSLYDMVAVGDRVYMSGYSCLFADYDRARPWNFSRLEASAGKEANPRIWRDAGGKYNCQMALGADGRVYFAGHHERHDAGCSLSAYDPKTQKIALLLREESAEQQAQGCVALDGGKLIVMGYSSTLAVYDVAKQEVTRRWSVPKEIGRTGRLLPAGPSAVVGLVSRELSPRGPGGKEATYEGVLYRLDLSTGKVEWQKTIPGRVFSGNTAADFRGHDERFCVGPDGCGWLFVDKVLTRVHPATGEVEAVMELEERGMLCWVGDDLYVYNGGRQCFRGFSGIHRVRRVFE